MQLVISNEGNQRKLKRAVETLDFLEQLKPGAVLYCSWGYEQTNIDFYKVLSRRGTKVVLAEMTLKTVPGSEGHDCDRVQPGEITDKVFSKQVRSPWIRMTSYSTLRLYKEDGRGLYRSWYY